VERKLLRKAVPGIMLTLVLIGMLTLAFDIQPAKAQGTIYIRADGSVEGTTYIQTADNVTYVFVGDINGFVVVERNNIIIDGKGFTLYGARMSYMTKGIDLSGRINVTVQNMQIKDFDNGIWGDSSSRIVISGNNLTYNGFGIYLSYLSNSTISRNNVINNGDSILIDHSSSNNVSGNNVINNGAGIRVVQLSNHNNVSGNNLTANDAYGVVLDFYSNNNTIFGNNVTANSQYGGIVLTSFSNCNTIFGNSVSNNSGGGIDVDPLPSYGSSLNNMIYHNNFIDNSPQACTRAGSLNVWDDGYPSGGNYWSDYNGSDSYFGPYQNETGSDGIGDTPYVIDTHNKDNFPLMGMFSDFNATLEQHIETICNSSISDFQFSGTAISFDVCGTSGTAGFCRICIPTALMNVTYKVFVNGTEVSYNLLQCSNETYSYVYFSYTHSTQEVLIIPEFASFLILPLFMIATLLAATIYKRKQTHGLQ
jgi:parallel beta-helix repeat protein